MNYEVEIKFRVADHEALERRLIALGGQPGPSVDQEDIYLSHPARDFARTDEALRLRRIGSENRITYKGPKLGGPTKTREEIEIPFVPGLSHLEQMTALMSRLGFRPVAVIRKSRRSFHLRHEDRSVEVALDLAEGLGAFAEVESLAADDADLPKAQAVVLALAGLLGLTEVEPRSYLRMTLERSGILGIPAGPT